MSSLRSHHSMLALAITLAVAPLATSADQAPSDSIEVPADPAPSATPAPAASETQSALEQPDWAPFEVGQEWIYVYVRETSRASGQAEPELEKLRGTLTSRIVANAPEIGPGVVRMRNELRGRAVGASAERLETRNTFVRSEGSSIQLLAEEVPDPASSSQRLTTYPSPLRLLEAGGSTDHRWPVGVRKHDGLDAQLEGQLLGVQDVQTPNGLFERCLVVRITGTITGVVEAYGNRMEVSSGSYSATEWYAPSVGRVLTKEELSHTLVMEDGSTLDYSERTQYALRSHASMNPVPASSPSPVH